MKRRNEEGSLVSSGRASMMIAEGTISVQIIISRGLFKLHNLFTVSLSLFVHSFQDQRPADCVDECPADVDAIGGGPGRVHTRTGQIPDAVRAEGCAGPWRGAVAHRYCDGRPSSVSTVDGTDRGVSAGEQGN